MDGVNKTLYIPLYGKALVSRRGILLDDPRAEAVWEKEGFPLKGKSASKWLAFSMAMRAKVFDRWVQKKLEEFPEAAVLHMGCGLDSRCLRTGEIAGTWYDMDFPEVIEVRKNWFAETEHYRMVPGNVLDLNWKEVIPAGGTAVVVMEGISMYLQPKELEELLKALKVHFDRVLLLMDCYSAFAARASKYKNPINDVGVTKVYGLDNPAELEGEHLRFCKSHEMTPQDLIDQLQGMEKAIFRKLYAGKIADGMYRLYEFEGV